MKTIFKLMALIICFNAYGQETIIDIEDRKTHLEIEGETYYWKDNNDVLNKFIGTWRYESGSTVFEITYNKAEHLFNGVDYNDALISSFIYSVNGNIIFDTTTGSIGNDYLNGGYFTDVNNLNKIRIVYDEPNQSNFAQVGTLIMEYNNNSGQETLNWSVSYIPVDENATPFQIPLNMTLVKQ